MEINELANIQKEFDSKHGWVLESKRPQEVLGSLNKDLIGLFGEIGEFSNLIKKLNLDSHETDQVLEAKIRGMYNDLSEELIDSFIYLFRIATHLDIDIEKTYLEKLERNRKKYHKYERREV